MFKYINALGRLGSGTYWIFKTLWLNSTNQVYIFRNAPTWFIKFLTEVGTRTISEENVELRRYFDQAHKELQLRVK